MLEAVTGAYDEPHKLLRNEGGFLYHVHWRHLVNFFNCPLKSSGRDRALER